MDNSKILLLIPGIIYGVGLVDLLKTLRPKIYWEIPAMAFLLFLTLIVNWFMYADRLMNTSMNLGMYALSMVTPLIFAKACGVLTPEMDVTDTKKYFLDIQKIFFLLMAAHVSVNIIIQILLTDDGLNIQRFVGVAFLLSCAFYQALWLRIMMMLVFASLITYAIINIQI